MQSPTDNEFVIAAKVRFREDWSLRGVILDTNETDHLCKPNEVLVRFVGSFRPDQYVDKRKLDVIY